MKRHFYSVKRWLSMVSCAALTAGLVSVASFPATQAEAAQRAAATVHDVNLSLGEWDQITENFESWYTDQISPDQDNKQALEKKSAEDLWAIKTEDNGDSPRLYRTEQHSGEGLDDKDGQNRRIAVLVYKKRAYTNFELEVDYLQGLNSWKWAMVGFGLHPGVPEREILGANGGYLAYFQQEGDAIVWGKGQTLVNDNGSVQDWASRIVGPKPEADQYDRKVKHTMKLTVKNKKLTVQTDNLTVFEANLPDNYDGGYIALAAGCNQAEFSNLKIR